MTSEKWASYLVALARQRAVEAEDAGAGDLTGRQRPLERFGLALMGLRHQQRLSREKLAQRCNLTVERVLELELGAQPLAQVLAYIPTIAFGLGAPVEALLALFEENLQEPPW